MAPPVATKMVSGTVSDLGITTTMIAPDAMPIRYQPTRHEYRYAGELALPTAPVEVLKVNRDIDAAAVSSLLRNVNLGPVTSGALRAPRCRASTSSRTATSAMSSM